MKKITQPAKATEWSAMARRSQAKVGFIPTMGALHEGHLDLVRRAKAATDLVVCSIFVNPLQFGNATDLERYPRQVEQDAELLRSVGCDMLFYPDKQGILGNFHPVTYDLMGLDAYWEGPSRPGHYQGVVNIVERLFFYVRPDQAFFGEKDRQQLTILRAIAKQQNWPVTIVPCPTVRAIDGLALSSRNQLLDPLERQQATVLYRTLKAIDNVAFSGSIEAAMQAGLNEFATEQAAKLDHLGIADALTLEPLKEWDKDREAVALIAAQVGLVRLIDNITLTRR